MGSALLGRNRSGTLGRAGVEVDMRLGVILAISSLVAVSVAQTTTRTGIMPAFTPRESAPAFIVECHNDSGTAVPWPTISAIRLDGDEQQVGGIMGSLLGRPDERFEVAPGGSHRLLFVLSQMTRTSSSSGLGFGARMRQGWMLPIAPGTHRLAVACLGQWSDEIAFGWSPDAPLGR
jgi:hypothetical protein